MLATEAAVGYIDAMMKEAGIPCQVKLDIYSSDCVPFADNGVPAVNFCRFGAPGANYIQQSHAGGRGQDRGRLLP